MEKKVVISAFEKITSGDVNNISLFPEKSLDDIVFDIGIPDQGFSGFAVSQTGPNQITVGNGRFYQNGLVYFNDTNSGYVIDLTPNLPLVTQRVVAIVVWGASQTTNVQPRTFLTDAVTRASVAQAVATEQWRWATISTVNGVEGPQPAQPAVASNVCVVAWVTLGVNGVISISPASSNVVPSVRSCATRLNVIEAWELLVGALVSTLRSDLTALASRINGLAPLDLVVRMAEDIARLDYKSKIPTTYASYGADYFLDTSESDIANVAYHAQINEGLRFPWAAQNSAQLGLLNPIDSTVSVAGNFMIPAYTTITRLSSIMFDTQMNIANNQYQTIDLKLLTRTRKDIRLGQSWVICSNWLYWYAGYYVSQGIFKRTSDGAEFVITQDPYDPNFVRVTQYFETTVSESYWDFVTTTTAVSGSYFAECFLNSQAGYLLEIGLYFQAKGATGDVTVSIAKCYVDGSPDVTHVVATTTIHVADILLNKQRTAAVFTPTLLDAGRRYAIVISTPGQHSLWLGINNKYAAGTLYVGTTGSTWLQGEPSEDLSFDAVFAQFSSPTVAVNLLALQLAGGITDIAINADTSSPPGTNIDYQVQISGVWKSCFQNPDLLVGLPPLLPFRAVLSGTQDIMPGIGLLSNSQVITSRSDTTLTHFSPAKTVSSTATIHVDIRIESWLTGGSPAHDVHNCYIMSGGSYATQTSYASLTLEYPIENPTAIILHYIFTMSPAVTTFKIKQTGTIDNAVTPYVICQRADVELT